MFFSRLSFRVDPSFRWPALKRFSSTHPFQLVIQLFQVTCCTHYEMKCKLSLTHTDALFILYPPAPFCSWFLGGTKQCLTPSFSVGGRVWFPFVMYALISAHAPFPCLIAVVCTLHIKRFILPVDSQHSQSSCLLLLPDRNVTWSQHHNTEILLCTQERRVKNAMACHRTGYDRYGMRVILVIQMSWQREKRKGK